MRFQDPIVVDDVFAASDGGSLGLSFRDAENTKFSLILDRAIGTGTYNRFRFNDSNELLESAEEKAMLASLERFVSKGEASERHEIIDVMIDQLAENQQE